MNVKVLKGVGEKSFAKLQKLGISTVEDLLHHYPRGYIDYTCITPLRNAESNTNLVLCLTILKKHPPRRIAGGRTLFKIDTAEFSGEDDCSGDVEIIYFNNRFAYDSLQEGEEYLFHGRITQNGFIQKSMISPIYISPSKALPISPIYPLTSGITSKYLSKLIKSAIAGYSKVFIKEFLPENIINRYSLIGRNDAVVGVHCPKVMTDVADAKQRLIFDELLCLQLGLSRLKDEERRISCAPMGDVDLNPFFNLLPFKPTNAQHRAVKDITDDLQKSTPQNRLLQGDVGSGKTVVAAAAAYFAAQNGYKTALMAPTELLCNQHYKTLSNLLNDTGIDVLLLSGSIKGRDRKVLLARLKEEKPCVLVATSAVLSEPVEFDKLGLCIVDEQHRFGVKQRSRLFTKADNPHVLVMSATPIPRTLALLIYGDLDISVLDELPKGRIAIKTRMTDSSKRGRMFGFLDDEIKKGRQIYIVCPVIDENEEGLQDVESYYRDIASVLLPSRRIGLLHGKQSAALKSDVMKSFAQGEIDVLCTTTVVEVGVDVPNATVMVIENAEQFGLATLHQLRGRVGRGSEESWCFLVSDSKSDKTLERLHRVVETTDGYQLAKYDLETRGPGNFFGSQQHGLPPLTVASLAEDVSILEKSTDAANRILATDPELKTSEFSALADEVAKMYTKFGDSTKN